MIFQKHYLTAEAPGADPQRDDQSAANHPPTYYTLRWFDWTAVALLLAALITAASRLVATDWTNDLPLVLTITVLGLIAGLALGQRRFTPAENIFFFFFFFFF